METNVKLTMGIIFLLISVAMGLIVFIPVEKNYQRLIVCFAFSALGLGFRALCYWEPLKDPENMISYPYYFITLIAIISSIFLGFYDTLMELPNNFFYFLSAFLFISMGFIVRTILSGLIK